jgi:filamentous hemagglutinin family protein
MVFTCARDPNTRWIGDVDGRIVISLRWIGQHLVQRTKRLCAWSLLAVSVNALEALPLAAQVVLPDGGTATDFVLGADGKITVGLAPAGPNGTSYNSYTRFSVPLEGVDLDNTLVGAGTIINEVTSANPTVISGALTVIGPQGHVIIANPNGITVNGGRFVTTGNVALTTGAMGVDGSGRPFSTVLGGDILVGENGLSGTMAGLDLIAKSIRVNGGVRFDFGTAPGAINHGWL